MSRIDSVTEHKVEDFQIASSHELCKVRVIERDQKMANLIARDVVFHIVAGVGNRNTGGHRNFYFDRY